MKHVCRPKAEEAPSNLNSKEDNEDKDTSNFLLSLGGKQLNIQFICGEKKT